MTFSYESDKNTQKVENKLIATSMYSRIVCSHSQSPQNYDWMTIYIYII